MALIADKGPYAANDNVGVPDDIGIYSITGSPRDWMRYNSFNHGGSGAGEGQNVFFADGHVDFEQTPIVGVDHDNIYTLMNDFASTTGRIWGVTPQDGEGTPNPWPGQGTFGDMTTPGDRATTDSLLWP
jgi:prepilin-type processing-associated H-X9-DG protein